MTSMYILMTDDRPTDRPRILENFERPYGATENARPDIARLDNARPYSKSGHRETCFHVRVYAH